MVEQVSPLDWVLGYDLRRPGKVSNTYSAEYSVKSLMEQGYIISDEGQTMLDKSGLEDFSWTLTWPEDYETPDEYLVQSIEAAQGVAIFIHGWTGNRTIWEELPGMTVRANRRLVAVSVDHNGFGKSIFTDVTPALDECNPPAAMQTIQRFVNLMRLRRQPGEVRHKVINLIGHSMGGATLFYLNPIQWRHGEVTCYALAPALLLEDEMYRRFYTTLGIGIGILQRVGAFKFVERFIKPTMINTLCQGASDYVKNVHSVQYGETPRGITGATFLAMGQLKNREIAHSWDLFRVMLGHRDRLVGLTGMMDLLSRLEFPVANTRVVPGSHYMFSIGHEDPANAFQHVQNRELVVQDVLTLHEKALKMQQQGTLVG